MQRYGIHGVLPTGVAELELPFRPLCVLHLGPTLACWSHTNAAARV